MNSDLSDAKWPSHGTSANDHNNHANEHAEAIAIELHGPVKPIAALANQPTPIVRFKMITPIRSRLWTDPADLTIADDPAANTSSG